MPKFTLQKVEGRPDPVIEKVIMKMQEKQRREKRLTRGLAAQLINFCTP